VKPLPFGGDSGAAVDGKIFFLVAGVRGVISAPHPSTIIMPSFVAYVVSLGCFAKSARRGRLSGPRLRPHSGRESEHILPLPLCSFHLELESFANLFFFNLIATCNECSAVTHAASPLVVCVG